MHLCRSPTSFLQEWRLSGLETSSTITAAYAQMHRAPPFCGAVQQLILGAFRKSVLGWINTDISDSSLIGKRLTRSTRLTVRLISTYDDERLKRNWSFRSMSGRAANCWKSYSAESWNRRSQNVSKDDCHGNSYSPTFRKKSTLYGNKAVSRQALEFDDYQRMMAETLGTPREYEHVSECFAQKMKEKATAMWGKCPSG